MSSGDIGVAMERRKFLQNLTAGAAGLEYLAGEAHAAATADEPEAPASVESHTLQAEFKTGATAWKAYEDLTTREGVITFISSNGTKRVLRKTAEASFAETTPA